MRKFTVVVAALLFAVSIQAADLTVDEVIAKNVEAKGGMEKLRALKSMRLTGKMSMGGMEAPFTMLKQRPESMRLEFTIQGLTGVQAYDGSAGWMVMPFLGKKDPEPMPGDMLKQMKEQADFDGPFIDYQKKGHTVELLGKEEIEGTPAYKLKLVTKEGAESTVYLDADSFLEIKMEAKQKVQGQEIEGETTFGNYQEVDGMLFPYSIEMKAKGAPAGQAITVEKIELNPTFGADLFAMPAAKPTPDAKQQ